MVSSCESWLAEERSLFSFPRFPGGNWFDRIKIRVGALVLFAVWLQTRPMSRKKRLFWAAVVVSATLLFVFYSSLGQLRVQDNLDEVVSWSGRLHGAAIIWMDTVRSSFSDLLLGIHPPEESYAYEMLYLSIYETYGVIGLLLWSLPFAFSLCAFFRYR